MTLNTIPIGREFNYGPQLPQSCYLFMDIASVIRFSWLRPWVSPGACFSNAPETFRALKAIFSLSVSKNREVYTPKTSCMKETSLHIKNMR